MIPTELKIDLSTLTWGELEEIERMTSGETARALLEGTVYPSALVALAFVVLRRDNPTILLEEVRRLPITTEVEVRTGKEEADPTTAIESNGDSPASPLSAVSTASDLPSFEG